MAISASLYKKARTSLVCSISISKPLAFNIFIAFSGDILFIASFSIGRLLSIEKQSNGIIKPSQVQLFVVPFLEPLGQLSHLRMALSESHVVILEDPKPGCAVLDHIILAEESYFSFADVGMI